MTWPKDNIDWPMWHCKDALSKHHRHQTLGDVSSPFILFRKGACSLCRAECFNDPDILRWVSLCFDKTLSVSLILSLPPYGADLSPHRVQVLRTPNTRVGIMGVAWLAEVGMRLGFSWQAHREICWETDRWMMSLSREGSLKRLPKLWLKQQSAKE